MGIKCVVFSSDKGDISADLAFLNNYNATRNPLSTDDITKGWRRGATWLNQTASTAWVCLVDTAGAAVWSQTSSTGEQNAQFTAPAATTVTGAGGAASLTGGTGGSTSGAGGAASQIGGAATAGNSAGGASVQTGGAGQGSAAGGAATQTGGIGGATGAGGASNVVGGAGGATSGTGGAVAVTGGAGTAGNANGGSVVVQGGAGQGSGVAGSVRQLGKMLFAQGAASAVNTTATLTAAQLLSLIITSTTAAAVSMTLPLATAMDTAIPDAVAGDSFDFSIINTGAAAQSITVVTNTGWTIVGGAAGGLIVAPSSATFSGAGLFRAAKTATGAWTLFRIS